MSHHLLSAGRETFTERRPPALHRRSFLAIIHRLCLIGCCSESPLVPKETEELWNYRVETGYITSTFKVLPQRLLFRKAGFYLLGFIQVLYQAFKTCLFCFFSRCRFFFCVVLFDGLCEVLCSLV